MHDVVIVGGGPGGLYSAQLLARRGFDVALFEEHPSTGAPVHCTGILAAEAFDEFGLSRAPILNVLHDVRFVSPAGHAIDYSSKETEAVAIDRFAFDQLLAREARSAGAFITVGRRVASVSIDRTAARLRLSDDTEVAARACVLACGANYTLQRRLGLGLPRWHLQSAQVEVPAATPRTVEVHFGGETAPGGFAWAVPVRRPNGWHARVGLMCEGDPAGHFRRFGHSVAERWGIAPGAMTPRRKILPLAPIRQTYADRLLVIGDAAGIVKATTGGGIYYSLVTALVASDVLEDGLRRGALDAKTLRRYETGWRHRLGPELDAQLELRQLAQQLGDDDIEAFFELARTDGVMPLMRKTARFNQHRHLILALFRHPPARRVLFKRLTAGASFADATRPQSA